MNTTAAREHESRTVLVRIREARPTLRRSERQVAEVVALVSRRAEPFPLPYLCRVQWAHLA